MGTPITINEEIQIAAPPDVVWDFTQDYSRRHEWDRSVASGEVLATDPIVKARIRGTWLCCEFHYKLFDPPRRTSLAMAEVESRIIEGGGGSWAYEADAGGTRWTQTNTVIIRDGLLLNMFRGALAWGIRRGTRQAMSRAKKIIERDRASRTL
jgi:hypothetical protein